MDAIMQDARLNVTHGGQNGDYPDPVPFDASDADIRQWATEAITTGYIPGIPVDAGADLGDFVVDRFDSTEDVPERRLFVRPKTPFGAEKKQVGVFVFGPHQDRNHPWVKEWQDKKGHKVVITPTHAELWTK